MLPYEWTFFLKKGFSYLFERQSISGGGGRGRGRGISSCRLPAECEARHGARSHNPEIMTCFETKNRTLNWLSHPGALMWVSFESLMLNERNQTWRCIYIWLNSYEFCRIGQSVEGCWHDGENGLGLMANRVRVSSRGVKAPWKEVVAIAQPSKHIKTTELYRLKWWV